MLRRVPDQLIHYRDDFGLGGFPLHYFAFINSTLHDYVELPQSRQYPVEIGSTVTNMCKKIALHVPDHEPERVHLQACDGVQPRLDKPCSGRQRWYHIMIPSDELVEHKREISSLGVNLATSLGDCQQISGVVPPILA
jgi:hypothetical protein